MAIFRRLVCFLTLTLFLIIPVSAFQKVEIDYPNTVIIYNLTMTSANTEYSQAFPAGCTKITVQCRDAYDVKICFTSGQSGTTYWTVKSGGGYWEDHISATLTTIYAQCATAGQVLEIICWYE